MTLSASADPDDHNDSKPGTGLTPAIEAGEIDPFLARAASGAPAPARSWHARLLDYSAHAAMIVGLIGFAWTVSGHVVAREPSPAPAAAVKGSALGAAVPATAIAEPSKTDELAALRQANRQMATDVKTLHASLEALRANVARTPDQVRALTTNLDEVRSELATARGEARAEVAQMSSKLEALRHEHEAAAKPAQQTDRVSKLERQVPDPTPTSSIPPEGSPKPVPKPPAKPTGLASADDSIAKPQVIAGWVVRDVYEGVAYVEGRRGTMEVVPGVSIPGAGVVKSIDRHGAGWTVTTTKGVVAYAAPPRETRRMNARDYYPRYDF